MRYINPFTDFGFKKLFGEEDSKDILIQFINDLIPFQDKIISINLKKNEQPGIFETDRKDIYYIYCEDDKGNNFIVKMQNFNQPYIDDRELVYSVFPIHQQVEIGELQGMYCITLLKFNLHNDKDYLNEITFKDQKNRVFYDKLSYFFIELEKFNKKETELETAFDRWIYFLKNLEDFEDVPEMFKGTVFEKAFEKAEFANFNENQKEIYQESLKIYRDNFNVLKTKLEEGLKMGMEQGIQQGLQQGLQRGIEQGLEQGLEQGMKKKSIEIAKSLLDVLDIETISNKTGLTTEEIEKLKKNIH